MILINIYNLKNISSSNKDTKPYGILLNVNKNLIESMGYILIYNHTYDWITTNNEISTLRSQCMQTSELCLAGADSRSFNLLLVACGNCFHITNLTQKNVPSKLDSVWWYYTPNLSWGFSPTYSINQNTADNIIGDSTSQYRLSWHTDGSNGGYRLGSLVALNNNNQYNKYIFIKY